MCSSGKACLGLLYFSQRRFDNEKAPVRGFFCSDICMYVCMHVISSVLRYCQQVCAGLSKKMTERNFSTSSESVPGGGDFRYVCVGYSAYDTEQLRNASTRRHRHDEPVEVPYCEGLEILSAAAVSRNRELLPHGAGAGVSSNIPGNRQEPKGERDASLEKHGRDAKRMVPVGNPMGATRDWEGFQERFEHMSKRIAEKMQSNATYMARSFVRSWQQIFSDRSSGSSGSSGRF